MRNGVTKNIPQLLLAFLFLFATADSLPSIQTKLPLISQEGIITATNGTTWNIRWPQQAPVDTLQPEHRDDSTRTIPSIETVDFAMVLAFMGLSGVVDAISFRYYKCFPNMMTGNTVKFLDSMVDARWNDAIWSASMILSYIMGTCFYKAVALKQSPRQRIPRTVGIVAQLTLVVFSLSDLMHRFIFPKVFTRLRLPLIALGFGMLNTVCIDVWGTVTYALTGHLHKVGSGLAESALVGTQKSWASTKSAWGLAAFAVAMFGTSFLLRVVEVQKWHLEGRLPPFGLTMGTLYYALLTVYSSYYQHFMKHTCTTQQRHQE